MSEQNADVTATETDGNEQTQQETKPAETVDHWKSKSREWEKRAKENAAAAKRLAELEDAQKSETEKAADRIAKAEAEVAALPAKVADALRVHLVALHNIDSEDAELFLTASDPDLLLKQVDRLVGQSDKRKKQHVVPREGNNPSVDGGDEREVARALFGGN